MPEHSPDQIIDLIRTLLQRPIAYHRPFAQIAGGSGPGLFLSQAWYWSQKEGTIDNYGWFYKTAKEWHKETGMTRDEQETARKKLTCAGILESKVAGNPGKLWFKINTDRVVTLLKALAKSQAEAERAERAARRRAGDDRLEKLPAKVRSAVLSSLRESTILSEGESSNLSEGETRELRMGESSILVCAQSPDLGCGISPNKSADLPSSLIPKNQTKNQTKNQSQMPDADPGDPPPAGGMREGSGKNSLKLTHADYDLICDRVFGHWKTAFDEPESVLDATRRKYICERGAELWRGGMTVERAIERLNLAIDGCKSSKWHMGENPTNTRYNKISLIFKSIESIDDFIYRHSRALAHVVAEGSGGAQTLTLAEQKLGRDDCGLCFGTGMETVVGKGARRCPACRPV